MTINATPLTPALGAKIDGIDLTQLTADDQRTVYSLLLKYQVLFFRGQHLTPADQASLAERFGRLHIHPIYPKVEQQPEILILDTALNDLRDNALWHTDVTFIETPPLGSILNAIQVPEYGGDTLWASSSAAYDALSPPIQQLIDGLDAEHDIQLSFPDERFSTTAEAQQQVAKARQDHPPVIHPVVRVHPDTGKKGLFVTPGFTRRIIGLSALESRALLELLFAHSTRPEFSVRWHWQANDVVFWDNRITQHYACDDYHPQWRVMHRATILGDKPKGP
ncbi:taurine dioxygenase [Rosenbergiella epipactidis]|uniref:taurine dioxygenase n=1 Tax=Rosenbergiella epipactidis TaxID=1544694 RepID=UPI001F4E0A69|nr:taurine dioxygenase [Rosenbergiella epipactidis]